MKLGLDLSLKDNAKVLTWAPSDETDVEFWYKFNTGFALTDGNVNKWADQSGENNHAIQTTAAEQPALVNGYKVEFDGSDDHFDLTTQITMAGEFTLGMYVNINSAGGTLIADNTTSGEFMKLFSNTRIRVKINNVTLDLDIDSGTMIGADNYLVITRGTVSGVDDTLEFYWNGVKQADTGVLGGTADIDVIGIRKADINPYDGIIYEAMLFQTSSEALTNNINLRLGTLPL
ncbi:MAG: hypothetical protein Unbinned6316contig1000_40 [Prokaryotic dsDNA virus sp.]|nr:MAG: hypothetical protein Unbinned6316contig1000_40 [Prokaryotic dsDNA virus sp.]|tara:strand:- start:9158 stop:9853 length:696 start_codon:yes stop_codon:yes gene_type:complete